MKRKDRENFQFTTCLTPLKMQGVRFNANISYINTELFNPPCQASERYNPSE